jgi:urease accessory protein
VNWNASLKIAYGTRDEGLYVATVPTLRRHEGPLRIQKGFRPEGPEVWHQVVVHPPGGIARGDQLEIDITAASNARVLLTTPGATKWYRQSTNTAPETTASQALRIRVESGACVEWLPMENIYFSGARARLSARFDLAEDATLIAIDGHSLGRPAAQEPFQSGSLAWHNAFVIADRLAYEEQGRIASTDQASLHQRRAYSTGLGGASAWAQLTVVSSQVALGVDKLGGKQWYEDLKNQGLAATCLESILLVRWRGNRVDHGMGLLREVWAQIRPSVTGRSAVAPRIWAT